MKITFKNAGAFALGVLMAGTLAITSVSLAATQQGTPNTTDSTKITAHMIAKGTPPVRPALTGFHYRIIGQITAVSGNTITVKDESGTTFTVDAATANIDVNGVKSTISGLAVNDLILVGGTAKDGTTTNITARNISKGTEKFDLSLKPNMEHGMGKGRGPGSFEEQSIQQ